MHLHESQEVGDSGLRIPVPILWRRIELIGDGNSFGEEYDIQLKKDHDLYMILNFFSVPIVSNHQVHEYMHLHESQEVGDSGLRIPVPILWRRIELIGDGNSFGEEYDIQLKKECGRFDDTALIKISQAYPNLIHLDVLIMEG
ncbi:hypothetical protein Glove_66g108 [Diversispora epigaea]|uniref:Uncharacterized protein n=1 Tax=Diversispora epigaea TaxID=1348612 RepID=A0A397JE74_9GLOM|nr:hypothetical protein Glove_66g108 [Diversispora epigaea]